MGIPDHVRSWKRFHLPDSQRLGFIPAHHDLFRHPDDSLSLKTLPDAWQNSALHNTVRFLHLWRRPLGMDSAYTTQTSQTALAPHNHTIPFILLDQPISWSQTGTLRRRSRTRSLHPCFRPDEPQTSQVNESKLLDQ